MDIFGSLDAVFSGLFWSGEQALDLGLADGLGSSSLDARDQIGAETIVDYTKKNDLLASLAERFKTNPGDALAAVLGGTALSSVQAILPP